MNKKETNIQDKVETILKECKIEYIRLGDNFVIETPECSLTMFVTKTTKITKVTDRLYFIDFYDIENKYIHSTATIRYKRVKLFVC